MKRLALAIALAGVLSSVARAGEIHSTGAVASLSPTPGTLTTTGEISSTGVIGEIPITGATSSTVLTIILTLISIVP